MKAQIESSGSNGFLGAVRSGKIQKSHKKQEDNAEEIKAYLNKLQEIVPFMPKNKKLSKIQIISYVIEYIRELRLSLGLPPCHSEVEDIEMEAMMLGHFSHKTETTPKKNDDVGLGLTVTVSQCPTSPLQRQPLCPTNCNANAVLSQTQEEISERDTKTA